jgi:hypothetical protein
MILTKARLLSPSYPEVHLCLDNGAPTAIRVFHFLIVNMKDNIPYLSLVAFKVLNETSYKYDISRNQKNNAHNAIDDIATAARIIRI